MKIKRNNNLNKKVEYINPFINGYQNKYFKNANKEIPDFKNIKLFTKENIEDLNIPYFDYNIFRLNKNKEDNNNDNKTNNIFNNNSEDDKKNLNNNYKYKFFSIDNNFDNNNQLFNNIDDNNNIDNDNNSNNNIKGYEDKDNINLIKDKKDNDKNEDNKNKINKNEIKNNDKENEIYEELNNIINDENSNDDIKEEILDLINEEKNKNKIIEDINDVIIDDINNDFNHSENTNNNDSLHRILNSYFDMEKVEADITNIINIGKILEENGLNEYNNIDGVLQLYDIIEPYLPSDPDNKDIKYFK